MTIINHLDMTRKELFTIIEKADGTNRWSNVYDSFMLVMIIMSVVPLAFWEEYTIFRVIEWITTGVFIIDYFLRWYTADYKLNRGSRSFVIYPISFWAILDLLSILPSFHFIGKAFKIVRTIRLLKMLRLLKALRYSSQILIFFNVLRKEKKILYSVLVISICYIFITALIMFNCEPRVNPNTGNPTFDTYFDALYWATVTLTTVGYGDLCPASDLGRFISMLSAIFGVAVIALPSGIITASYLDELKEIKGEKFANRLQKSFKRIYRRKSEHRSETYYIVPRTVSIANIQVNQGMDMKDIIDTAEKYPQFRLRNMATAIPESQKPEDRVVVEHFPLNNDYGCCINRKSKVTIVSPCSYSEAGIGNTAYYLALIGGFNYVSKELETDRDVPVDFINIDSAVNDDNRDKFIKDVKELSSGKDNWVIVLKSVSSERDYDFYLSHGKKKEADFAKDQHSTIVDVDTYRGFYKNFAENMQGEFNLKSVQNDRYPLEDNHLLYNIGGGSRINGFTLRISYFVTCWESNRLDKLQVMAETIKKHLEPGVPMPKVADLADSKRFGYVEDGI